MNVIEKNEVRSGVMNDAIVSFALFGWLSLGIAFAFGSVLALVIGIVFIAPAVITISFGFAKDIRNWITK